MTTDIKSAKSARFSTRTMTMTAILSVIAFVLAFLEIPVPVIAPSFVKLDLSDFPALIGAFAFGPMVDIIPRRRMICTSGSAGSRRRAAGFLMQTGKFSRQTARSVRFP